jgi:hypothetical protein
MIPESSCHDSGRNEADLTIGGCGVCGFCVEAQGELSGVAFKRRHPSALHCALRDFLSPVSLRYAGHLGVCGVDLIWAWRGVMGNWSLYHHLVALRV